MTETLPVEENALWNVLHSVPDHRDASGRRYPLPAVLCIALAALLAGRSSVTAIRRWARRLPAGVLREMGIRKGRAPSQGAWHYLFRDLHVDALEAALGAWVGAARRVGETLRAALDGKVLRGSRAADYPALHLLALYCEELEGVLGEWRVEPDANEITAALRMLRASSLENLIVTGDAIFAQKEICRTITEGGGDYFFVVKGNQPALRDDIEMAFAPAVSPLGGARAGA